MKRRYRYSYNIFDYIYNLTWPVSLIPCRKHNLLSLYNRYKLLKKGEDKYIKEFDAVYFARSLRNLKMLVASLMDDSERFLSTYQHFNTIKLGLDSNGNSSSDSHSRIPKLLSSKNCRLKHEKWIDDFMNKYLQERFSPKDYRLMNCVCTNKELTNEQLNELEISKADSHLSNSEELERKLREDSSVEEKGENNKETNKTKDMINKYVISNQSFKNIFATNSKTNTPNTPQTIQNDKNLRSNEDEIESLFLTEKLELPRASIGLKMPRNEFKQMNKSD